MDPMLRAGAPNATVRPRWRSGTTIALGHAWLAPMLLAGCAAGPPPPASATAAPAFDPIAFFAGRTEGRGRLRVVLSHPHAVQVHGTGMTEADGALRLVQDVKEEGKPASRREWVIRRVASGRYVASLSDARGPVSVEVTGDRLHLRFRMAHGLAAEQWLVLQPDGRAAQNRMTVKKLGIVVARLDERIVRQP